MYMHEGKPIEVPYGRRNVNVTRLEFQDALAALAARIEALEGGTVVSTGYAHTVEQYEGIEDAQVIETTATTEEPVTVDPKPRRGRPPKEATE